jgi:hypothetical protein
VLCFVREVAEVLLSSQRVAAPGWAPSCGGRWHVSDELRFVFSAL